MVVEEEDFTKEELLKIEEEMEKQDNPWAICTAALGEQHTDRWERCVQHVKRRMGKRGAIIMTKKKIEKEVEEEAEPKTCPKCGAKMNEGICESCGYKETKKDTFGGQTPAESAEESTSADATTTPQKLTAAEPVISPAPATGETIGSVEEHPVTIQLKGDPNFRKSPVGQYIAQLEKKIERLEKAALSTEELEKMFSKWAEAKAPIRKAIMENVGSETFVKSEATQALGFEKRFSL